MVDEVELIIRSIEDEKTAVEERVRTRDVFARIEGLEREKVRRATSSIPPRVAADALDDHAPRADAHGPPAEPPPGGGVPDRA